MGLLNVSTASASSVNSAGFEAANAIDMVVSSASGDRWAASSGLPQWLMLDLGASQVADYYSIAPGGFATNQDPSSWTFEGSHDATSWTVISTISSWPLSGSPKTFSVSNSTAYRYYRINISATGGGVASLSEFRVGIADPATPAISESATGTVNNATSGTVAITSTPTTGQIVIVSAASNRTDLSVSGLGATWTRVANGMASSWSSTTHTVWIGTNASSSGNVTVTAGGAFNAQLLALTATNCDGTNIINLANGGSAMAYAGQLVLTAAYEGSSGTPVLGGTTTPTSASWTSTSQFTATSGHKIRQAYILASGGGYTAQWTGLGATGTNTVVLGFALPEPTSVRLSNLHVETLATGLTSAQIESAFTETLATGVPTVQLESAFIETMTLVQPAQVSSVYAETLLSSTPPVQVETVYAEALLTSTPPVQVSGMYIEALLLPVAGPLPFKGWGVPV